MDSLQQIALMACIIQGEGERLGPLGMFGVATTIAERLKRGQDIERIDREYYGNDMDKGGCTVPSLAAVSWAIRTLCGEVPPCSYPFVYSRSDVERGGYPAADFVMLIDGGGNGKELHFYKVWPVETLRRRLSGETE